MERELIILLQSISEIRDWWIKEKDHKVKDELFTRLVNLYSVLGSSCDDYLKCLKKTSEQPKNMVE